MLTIAEAPEPTRKLSRVASQWKSLQRRLGKAAEQLVRNEGPKLIRQLQNSPTVQRTLQQGVQRGVDALLSTQRPPQREIAAGRPVTRSSVPSAQRARKVVYAPDLDGRADPGEIVWTWVAYEDDPSQGKDRPVLVVGRDRRVLLGLMLSSREYHDGDQHWVGIGRGAWDAEGRESWVRLDRVLDVPEEGIRREGAVLDRTRFEVIATRLRADYSWS
ncbi:type II toxin-antitoxin system PemK/MazF family toxin [Mycobacterium sp. MYCO198283]|uniref:type II toxin-antitoxin system PemK/MazF family toxin n=1 Tax=Mycobacterium sp. MYCO198283 TaxID=2883505 RepID=UPI001E5647ED|nr:type II toxin-antitoxin system PemK/MazF family toxin [Mycobacterium sp. MYCO198283]MCG5432510.1 type II toxin-antitoxin system PemK/MazF family toxin [Mycobacterium sp. MYCO198283]